MNSLVTALYWLYPLSMLIALIASVRHIRLTKSSPLLAGGFGLAVAANLLSRMMPMIMMRWLNTDTGQSLAKSMSPLSTSPFTIIHVVLTSIGACGWALIAFGLYSVLSEVSEKLAMLQLAPQNAWNYQAAPNTLQNGFVPNQHIQHVQQTSPFLPQQPSQHNAHGAELLQEETHASAFVSPMATAPPISVYGAAAAVLPEQPDVALTLGSSQQ